jgi:hypothetical protein
MDVNESKKINTVAVILLVAATFSAHIIFPFFLIQLPQRSAKTPLLIILRSLSVQRPHCPYKLPPCPAQFCSRTRDCAVQCVELHAIMSLMCHDLTSHEYGIENAAQCFNRSRERTDFAHSQPWRLRYRKGRPQISKASRCRRR